MNEQSLLAQALKSGQMETAKDLLNKGEHLPKNLYSHEWGSIFSQIIEHKAFDVLDSLMEDGSIETDIYEYDSFNNSIFQSLIRFPANPDFIEYLRSLTARFQSLNTDIKDQTLLGFAFEEGADPEIIRSLVDAGCDITYKNNAEENFIFQIVNNGALALRNKEKAIEYLKFLIAEGLEINTANIVGTTPLHAAIDRNQKEYLDLLLENGADPNAQDKRGRTPFYNVVVDQFNLASYEKMSRYDSPLFELRAKDEGTFFAKYVSRLDRPSENDLKLLKRLLLDGADVQHTSDHYAKEKSALDWAAEKSSEVLLLLLENTNTDINEQDNEGNTLLHKVCGYDVNYDQEKAKEIYRKVKLLLSKGADISIQNDKDETALMLASKDNLKSKTVELLLQK